MKKTSAKLQNDRYKTLQDTQDKCWWMDERMDEQMDERTETCTPKLPMLKQVRQKHVQSFKKIGKKLYEELHLQGTHCHNIFIESVVRKWQSSQSGKSNKN